MAAAAIVAAAYAALTTALAPISYGAIQLRLSEVLCILPFFFPMSAAGLFVGCLIANLFSPMGAPDIIFGSLATLLAGLCTGAIGRRALFSRQSGNNPPKVGWGSCFAACAMPVVFNAVFVGGVLALTLSPGESFLNGFLLFGAQVGLGEGVVMFLIGLPIIRLLLKNPGAFALLTRLGKSPSAGDQTCSR